MTLEEYNKKKQDKWKSILYYWSEIDPKFSNEEIEEILAQLWDEAFELGHKLGMWDAGM